MIEEKNNVLAVNYIPTFWRLDAYKVIFSDDSIKEDFTFKDHLGNVQNVKEGEYIVLLDAGKKILKVDSYVFESFFKRG